MIRFAYGYSGNESNLVFSLTIPQMAATLASAVVGYQTKNAEGERLLDAGFVNAVLVLVVSCAVGPVLSSYWGRRECARAPATPEGEVPAPQPAGGA